MSLQQAHDFAKRRDYVRALKGYEKLISDVDITDYLLPNVVPDFPKKTYIEILSNTGMIYKGYFEGFIKEHTEQNRYSIQVFANAVLSFSKILTIDIDNVIAKDQLISIYTEICWLVQGDHELSLQYLNQIDNIIPGNDTVNYNLGFIYQKINNAVKSIYHYKLAIISSNNDKISVHSLNGLACVYRNIKKWTESLHYLLKADRILSGDPDINNQLGIVYTELRATNLALEAYNIAKENYMNSFITENKDSLLSEIHLNMGHMYSYNGDNSSSIKKI